MADRKPRPVARDAWLPPNWEPADASAMQALAEGVANADQQKRALRWIMVAAAGVDEPSYRPDSDQTVFAEGRRFVGLQIRKLLIINVSAFVRAQQHAEDRKPAGRNPAGRQPG